MAKLLVVVGATGTQGRAVIKYFQQHEPSWHIRGLTRTPQSKSALALTDSGVEVVQADLNNAESLGPAFADADYIFAYTDFSGIVRGPEVMGKFKAGELSLPIGAESYKIEFQQGKNIADAAANVPELKRLVWSALPHVKRASNGKYTHVYHFDAKAEVFEYMLENQALAGKVSAAHMGAFVTNAINGLELWKLNKTDDGSIFWQPPFSVTLPIPYVNIEKDAGSFVHALFKAPAPTQVLVVSEWATAKEWSERWSQITGVQSNVKQADPSVFKGEDPTSFMKMMLETSEYMDELGFTGGDKKILMPEELEEQGFSVNRTKLIDYISDENWSSIID